MTAEHPPGFCFYPIRTGHIDGSVRACCRPSTASFGTLPVCSQHHDAMLSQMRQAIWDSEGAAGRAREALRTVERRAVTTPACSRVAT